jgi:hypothetical protein
MQKKLQVAIGLLILGFCHASYALNTASHHLICSTNDTWNESAEITVTGTQVSVLFKDKVDPSTTASGYATSAGEFNLDQIEFGCGGEVTLSIDGGLLDGGMTDGSATVTYPGNYGCEGGTIEYSCKVQ